MTLINDVKNNIKILLDKDTLTDKENLLIEAYIQEILSYCYRDEIIEKMVLPLSDVIAYGLKNKAILDINGNISSYSEGDLSVSFATTQDGTKYNGKMEAFKLVRGLADV